MVDLHNCCFECLLHSMVRLEYSLSISINKIGLLYNHFRFKGRWGAMIDLAE